MFKDIKKDSCIIAYEPLYSIGTGVLPTKDELTIVIKALKDKYQLPVLYGGSVNDKNIIELKNIPNLDGFLLGGISLDLKSLKKLIEEIE